LFLNLSISFQVNAGARPRQLRRYVASLFHKMNRSRHNRIRCSVFLLVLFCFEETQGLGSPVRRIQLTDQDRAAIVGSVARNIFRPGSNYEGKHFILADGIRAEWIPKIVGYDVTLVTRKEIETANTRIFYYVVQLCASTKSVHVTVTGYDSESKDLHVVLHYSYWRAGHGWRGKYLWGAGD